MATFNWNVSTSGTLAATRAAPDALKTIKDAAEFLDGLCIGNKVADSQCHAMAYRLSRLALPLAFWAVAFHPRNMGRKWYRVSRMIEADGMTFELYWHGNIDLRGKNLAEVRQRARDANVTLAPGVYTDAESPKLGSEMRRVY